MDHPFSALLNPSRRNALNWLGCGAAALALSGCGAAQAEQTRFPVQLTDKQWRERLSRAEYRVLRGAWTERPYSSPLHKEYRAGVFLCAGCGSALYSSATKFDSGNGWPSFYAAQRGAVATKLDHSLILPRVEVHCANCGGHLGHIFDDGPKPTGKRHCINGAALDFRPA